MHPEYKEKSEKYREQQIFNPELGKKVIDKINKVEKYPDIIFCPVDKCRNPISIDIKKDNVRLYCKVCGWEKNLKRST